MGGGSAAGLVVQRLRLRCLLDGFGAVQLLGAVVDFMRRRRCRRLLRRGGQVGDAHREFGPASVKFRLMFLLRRTFQMRDPLLQMLHLHPLFLTAPGHAGKGRAGIIQPGADAVEPLVIRRLFAPGRPAFQNRIGLRHPIRHRGGTAAVSLCMAEMLQLGAQKPLDARGGGVDAARPGQAKPLADAAHRARPICHQPVIRGEHPRLPPRPGFGVQNMAQPQQQPVVGVIIRPPQQRIGNLARMAVDADKSRLAARIAQRLPPERQQPAQARVLQREQMRPAIIRGNHRARPLQKLCRLGRGKPVGGKARKAEPGDPGRGEQVFVQPGDQIGFEKALGVDLGRTHQVFRQITAHLPQHPGQRRGAGPVHPQHHQRGAGAGDTVGRGFFARCHFLSP